MSMELLKRLSEALGIPGREEEVRVIVRAELDELGLTWREDALGNLLVDAGGTANAPRLLIEAHMDEIGLMVSYIHPNGAVAFALLGGWDARNLPAQEVTIQTSIGYVTGVIGSKPPHIAGADDRSRAWTAEALWIDLGTTSEAETRKLGVEVGDPVVLDGRFSEIRPGVFRGKAFDDRVGCYVILEVLRQLAGRELPVQLSAAFTVMEEVGTRGIRVLGASQAFDYAIHLEGTVAADVPGVAPTQCPSQMGRGPVITVIDSSIIVAERMVDYLETLARENQIPTQRKRPIYGGTNAGAMHILGKGVLCGIISAPCRFIHSPVTLLRKDDLDAMVRLAVLAVTSADRL